MHAFLLGRRLALIRLDLVEAMPSLQGYTYHRMDGSTSVATRARLIDDFNNNPEGEGAVVVLL